MLQYNYLYGVLNFKIEAQAMIELRTFMTGIVLGMAFAVVKAEIPAPVHFAGVLGIIGVWLGYKIIATILN